MRKKIAIVGSGIAGMACVYFLRERFDLSVFEADTRSGGHTHTVRVDEDGVGIPIDTGFIVYNEGTYPNLTRFFKELNVPTIPSDMSFSVQHLASDLEYSGSGLGGLFAQKKNWFRPAHFAFLGGISRFNRECSEVLENADYASYTLARYAVEKKIRPDVLEKFLIPMASAVWSTPPDKMMDFPIATLVRFFKNHGFLGLNTQYPWRTVKGGSESYKTKILGQIQDSLFLGDPVVTVSREDKGVRLRTSKGRVERFDAVILATHADQALRILENPSAETSRLLSPFRYQKNTAVLHTDEGLLPRNKKIWSSWNVRLGAEGATTTYWMNKLQPFGQKKNYFVTLNSGNEIDPAKVLRRIDYEHPLLTPETDAARKKWGALNEAGPIYFTGSYFRYGFHEDAFTASLDLCRRITGENLWTENPGLSEDRGRLSE